MHITTIAWTDVPPIDVLAAMAFSLRRAPRRPRSRPPPDTRTGLWNIMADAIDALRPRLVVIENVRGLLSALAHRNQENPHHERTCPHHGRAPPGDPNPEPRVLGDGSCADRAPEARRRSWRPDRHGTHARRRPRPPSAAAPLTAASARFVLADYVDPRSTPTAVQAGEHREPPDEGQRHPRIAAQDGRRALAYVDRERPTRDRVIIPDPKDDEPLW